MSIAKIEKLIGDLERKLNKSIKLLAKGDKLSYADGIKLGRKSNSMISTVKKAIKEYDVRGNPSSWRTRREANAIIRV